MKKAELIKAIDRGNRIEEEAIEALAKHINGARHWSGLDAHDSKKVQDVLDVLMKDSKEHYRMLERLKKRIAEEDKDVY